MGRAGVGRAAGGGPWFPTPDELDAEELQRFGLILDRRPMSLQGQTVAMALAEKMLKVRTRDGDAKPLIANPVQALFEERRGQRNIVLKARQMGFTTWAAARFFLKTITQPGTLTLEVAHTQEAAEEIFRIVRRFLDCLPEALRGGPLKTSRSNVRALAFPVLDAQYLVVSAAKRNAGRGLTVQNLHCSEVARWPGDPAETLAGLRAALAPQGEMVLESTPDGIGGCFYEEWMKADETGMVQHFFPWWKEQRYRALPVKEESLTEEERALREKCGLDLAQIGYRRGLRANFRGRVMQEYAENWVSCFRATGDPVFELRAVEERLQSAPRAVTTRRNGELEIWLPPQPGKTYVVGVDPAEGGCEGDYSAVQVLELETGLQCAELAAHVGGTELARRVVELANEYNQAWVAVERNGPGSGVLVGLEDVCHYARIFRKEGKDGWTTNATSRVSMLGKLDAALIEAPQCFFSAKFLAECRSFVRLRNGSTGARAGTHDDRVMAMALALAARADLLMSHR